MVTGPASSAENGDPRRPAPSPPPPQLLSHRQPPTHWALSSLPSAQPPLRRACARRWHSHVNPALNRKTWTEQEERHLSIIKAGVSRESRVTVHCRPADPDAHKGWDSACEARETRPS